MVEIYIGDNLETAVRLSNIVWIQDESTSYMQRCLVCVDGLDHIQKFEVRDIITKDLFDTDPLSQYLFREISCIDKKTNIQDGIHVLDFMVNYTCPYNEKHLLRG